MKRRRKQNEESSYDNEQFIERKILIGLVTDSNYTAKVLALKNVNPVQLLASTSCKMLANWCIEYYNEYHEAPGKKLEDIFMEHTDKIDNETAQDVEEILAGLSDEYEEKGGNDKYLFDRTFKHFQLRQAEILRDKQDQAISADDLDEFYKQQISFKPIQIESEEKTTFKGMEIYNEKIKPIKWLIDDLIPKGLTIFGGQSKLGKSYLALNMTMHLAQDKYMFADQSSIAYKGARGPVLYLALEDPKERLKNRILAIEPNPDEKLLNRYFTITREWNKLYKGGLADLEEWLKKAKRPKLIVIDVIAKVWNMKNSTGAGRWYNQEYEIFSPLSDLAHKYDTSIIAITHTKKGKEADVFNEILGGAGTQGPADNLMVLSRRPGNSKQRVLAIRGKDMQDRHLLFDVYDNGATWECEGEVNEVQKTNERQSIVAYLRMTGTMSLKDIQQAAKDGEIEISPNSVAIILRKMENDGTLIQPTYGKYSVPGRTNGMIKINQKRKKR